MCVWSHIIHQQHIKTQAAAQNTLLYPCVHTYFFASRSRCLLHTHRHKWDMAEWANTHSRAQMPESWSDCCHNIYAENNYGAIPQLFWCMTSGWNGSTVYIRSFTKTKIQTVRAHQQSCAPLSLSRLGIATTRASLNINAIRQNLNDSARVHKALIVDPPGANKGEILPRCVGSMQIWNCYKCVQIRRALAHNHTRFRTCFNRFN